MRFPHEYKSALQRGRGSCELAANCSSGTAFVFPITSASSFQEKLHPRPPAQGRGALGRLLGEERREHVHIPLGVQVGGAQKLARRHTSLSHIPAIGFIARGVGKLNCTTHGCRGLPARGHVLAAATQLCQLVGTRFNMVRNSGTCGGHSKTSIVGQRFASGRS